MPAISGEFPIYVTSGEPRPAWCDGCMTSAAVMVDMYGLATIDGAPDIARLGTMTICQTCQPEAFD